jgi:hypothetical protein
MNLWYGMYACKTLIAVYPKLQEEGNPISDMLLLLADVPDFIKTDKLLVTALVTSYGYLRYHTQREGGRGSSASR